MSVGRTVSPLARLLAAGLACAALATPANATVEAKVPDVIIGPEAAESAARVDAPIAEVTVYSDRARVRRRGRTTLKGAAAVVRLPDLPGQVFLDTIRVATTGGRVLRVEATPIERERLEIEQAGKLLDALDAIDDRLMALDDRGGVEKWELDLLGRLRPAKPVPEEKREGRRGLAIDVPAWWKVLDFLGERATAARTRLLRVGEERAQLEAERARLHAEIAKMNQGGFSDRRVQVIAVLEPSSPGSGASCEIEVEYFVPGASWKPAYNLYFSSARGQLTMETTAVVQQATGETWPQAALAFSTATPGRGIDMPELLTWTLGERSEFLPTLRPRQPPRVEPLLPMGTVAAPAAASRAIAAELLRERLSLAARTPNRTTAAAMAAESRAVADAAADEKSRAARAKAEIHDLVAEALAAEPSPEGGAIDQLLEDATAGGPSYGRAKKARAGGAGAPMAMPPPAPTVASAPAVRRSQMQSYRESEASVQSADADDSESSGISWRDVVVVPRKMSKASRGNYVPSVALSLLDTTAARRPPALTDPYLPAVSGGGLDYVYRAPTAATVESTGKEVRIPLASQAFRMAAFYEATPALATTAFLRARVRNDGKRPLLRGPAAIFGDGEFVGTGEMKTTGPSGDIEFPLGADQDIRLTRQIVPSTKTTGLILKEEETVYDVLLQIGNYKKQAVTVEVIDQVPVSRNDQIHVKLVSTAPQPVGPADLDGVIRWRVELPAGQTRAVKLRYQITRPKDWKLYQR